MKRSDPVYMAHGYLTKVPVTAIIPFIEAFTEPGDLVCDLFAGSGMTGVAALMSGRRAELSDISELGAHIGNGYLNLVPGRDLDEAVARVEQRVDRTFPGAYLHPCARHDGAATLSKRVWTFVYACGHCNAPVNFYETLEAAGWSKREMQCPSCGESFVTRNADRIGEVPVLDSVSCSCSAKLIDQAPSDPFGPADPATIDFPSEVIESSRQMYQASALAKHGLNSTSDFFSPRNLAVLAALRNAIAAEDEPSIREKLMFAFTAILPRASKRYQWSRQRPLNAANGNYYIAPVFYEWNVLDLFVRKVRAAQKADRAVRAELEARSITQIPSTRYRVGSATDLDLEDGTVDYVFTDPPFGSNIFYSDMNLFQEAWLGRITDYTEEAVVDRGKAAGHRSAERYEQLLTDGLREAHRVLKDDGWLSLNFSNSSGALWALVQRAICAAGFTLDPDRISVLDKGQRSVKGLASGFENVVTADLVLSMRKSQPRDESSAVRGAPDDATARAVDEALALGAPTPTHVYLHVVRSFLRHRWDASQLHIADIGIELTARDLDVDPSTGRLIRRVVARS
ncbi:MAG: DNA methylase [Patulibacter sp.]|nr:DNA methylase [Patulibacter sp.]